MPSFQTTTPVAHRADQMYDLVADVTKYPEFLPLCEDLQILQQRTDQAGNTVLLAEMTVAYTLFRETFTSRVLLKPQERCIETSYVDGPFEHMENTWRFEDTAAGADCHFAIDYAFRSRALALVMSQVFDGAFRRFATAFEARADELYG